MKYTSLRKSLAHESEVEFARMLLSTDLYKTEEYYKWAGLFPYTYGGNVEEIKENQLVLFKVDPGSLSTSSSSVSLLKMSSNPLHTTKNQKFRLQPRSISTELPLLPNFIKNVLWMDAVLLQLSGRCV